MNRCKNCIHWEQYKPDEWHKLRGAGKCLAARQIWEVTEVDYDDDEEPMLLLPEHAGVLALVEDGSGYAAALVTMADFGCVMHAERKE